MSVQLLYIFYSNMDGYSFNFLGVPSAYIKIFCDPKK